MVFQQVAEGYYSGFMCCSADRIGGFQLVDLRFRYAYNQFFGLALAARGIGSVILLVAGLNPVLAILSALQSAIYY